MLALALALLAVASATTLTPAEVAWHDRPEDCWLILDGSVYDVTAFIAVHPGGEAILRGCGKDASGFFAQRDAAGGHSAAARALLDGYRLGALGEELVLPGAPPPAPHPHDLTADGPRAGLLPTAGMAPGRSINLHIAHHLPTGADQPARVLFQLGYAPTAWSEVVVSDVTGDGISGLEARLRPLDQHRGRPLSAVVVAGGGFNRTAEQPAGYGALTLERALLDRRLMLRAASVAALAPAVQVSAGGGLEFRPIPIHGLFGEILVPTGGEGHLAWTAGARIYTRGHHFSVYASSTPGLSLGALGAPADGMSLGFALDRAFRLGS